jgi:hypothetical protein
MLNGGSVSGVKAAPAVSHRPSESWRAGKCDRPCESDGTSDAVASSARTCVEAASQPRDDGTRPSGQHRDLPRGCSIKAPTSYPTVTRAVPNRSSGVRGVQRPTEVWGTERLDRRSRRRQAGSPSGSVPSVGKAELAGKAEYISEQATLRQESNSKPQSGGNRRAERDALLNTPRLHYRVFRRHQRLR